MLISFLKFLLKLLADLWDVLVRAFAFWRGVDQKKDCCVCPPALKKPDPFLYDQYYLMSLGLPVTWDNPDIFIYEGTTLVNPYDLKASTTYSVVARIWNNSVDVPVINLGVAFSYLSFGMGTVSHPVGSTTTDLGAKGLPGCPAFAYMDWTTPAELGHYCLQVLVEPPNDSNWLNNLGQRNTQVAQPHSPATFTFTVGNHVGPRPRTVFFTVDSYAIPPLKQCSEKGRDQIEKSPPPVPPGWTVVLTPDRLILEAGQEKQIEAQITPPAGFKGTMPINVHAWDKSELFGGVTLYVEVL